MRRKHQPILLATALLQVAILAVICAKSCASTPSVSVEDKKVVYEIYATSSLPRELCSFAVGFSVIQHGIWHRLNGVSRPIRVIAECSDGEVEGLWKSAEGELEISSEGSATLVELPKLVENQKPASIEFEYQVGRGFVGDDKKTVQFREFAKSANSVDEPECHSPYWGDAAVQCQVDLGDVDQNDCENALMYTGYRKLAQLVGEGLPAGTPVDMLGRCAGGLAELNLQSKNVAHMAFYPEGHPELKRLWRLNYKDPVIFDASLFAHPIFEHDADVREPRRDYVAESAARKKVIGWWLGFEGEFSGDLTGACFASLPGSCSLTLTPADPESAECRTRAVVSRTGTANRGDYFKCVGGGRIDLGFPDQDVQLREENADEITIFEYRFRSLRLNDFKHYKTYPVIRFPKKLP